MQEFQAWCMLGQGSHVRTPEHISTLFTAFGTASAPFQLKKLDLLAQHLLAQHVCAPAYLPAWTNFDQVMREDDNILNTLIFFYC